jgi:hypothetical protein
MIMDIAAGGCNSKMIPLHTTQVSEQVDTLVQAASLANSVFLLLPTSLLLPPVREQRTILFGDLSPGNHS